ncbi:MAG TPA: lipoate--protein ligase [Draconibacterium sp.]|nr:lipoate--protein ligase [Draconibacterium sp.]
MICMQLNNTNAYFCLAAEEYLLKNFDDDIFMLWQSKDTVVVGKHQNTLAEINYPFIREKNVTVARRISGGGTVFHDAGNVNFCYIKNVGSPSEISFKMFTEPVVEALARLGIEATTSGRNDLLINGLKISGNAEHVYKNRVLHHGTLLFNSDLENLGQAIKVVPGKYESKAVESNRSKVANISGFLDKEMTTEEFTRFLLDVQLMNPANSFYALTDEDVFRIEELMKEKFSTWEWNYGYSPKYSFKNSFHSNSGSLKIELNVNKGTLETVRLEGSLLNDDQLKKIMLELTRKEHRYEVIESILKKQLKTVSPDIILAFF